MLKGGIPKITHFTRLWSVFEFFDQCVLIFVNDIHESTIALIASTYISIEIITRIDCRIERVFQCCCTSLIARRIALFVCGNTNKWMLGSGVRNSKIRINIVAGPNFASSLW